MKNFILLALCFIFLFACSSDNDNPQQEMEQMEQMEESLPSNFVITVDSIWFDVAAISWTKPEGANNENLFYDISLNDVKIAEELTALNYIFEGLTIAENFEIEITASNSFGTITSVTTFETLDPENFTILLKEFKKDNGYTLNYYYNSDNLVTRRTAVSSGELEYNHQITYGANQIILKADVTEPIPQGEINYEYEGGNLKKILAVYFDGESTTYRYTFTNPNDYEFRFYNDNLSGDPPIIEIFEINLQRDADNRIVEFRITDTNTQEEGLILFQYSNGNLIKINEVTSGIVWDIEYDTMKSFYVPGIYQHSFPYHYVGLEGFTFENIRNIPGFRLYKNSNNPIRIKKNNVVEYEYEYEYYSHGYPSKIVENGLRNIDLTYEIR